MKKFDSFLVEAVKGVESEQMPEEVATTFGRFQPPHMGHGKVLTKAKQIADSLGDKNPVNLKFNASRTQDGDKNPLPFQLKMRHLKEMFPQFKDNWDEDEETKTFLQAAQKYNQQGAKKLHLIGGADRKQMGEIAQRYNGQLYDYDDIYYHNAGERDDKSDDPTTSISASKMRNWVKNNDFEKFKTGLKIGKNFDLKKAKQLFDDVQMFGAKNESYEPNIDMIRESYKDGKIYNIGDIIEHKITGLIGNVHRRGSNHLICVTEEGIMFKAFLQHVNYI